MRLARYLSQCGVSSRRAGEELIRSGKVKVNDRIIRDVATNVDPAHDLVRVRNKIIKPPQQGVVLFHKPRGVVSTLSDPQGRRSVGDYLPRELLSYFPVGRLDWDSTGLMILTNDGDLAERLLHPRYELPRIYHVRVEGLVDEALIERLARGVRLRDGLMKARATKLRDDRKGSWLEVSISEGRNRVLRRLLQKVGHPVIKLKRVAHGPFQLGRLQPGELRPLSDKDYQHFRKLVFGSGFGSGKA